MRCGPSATIGSRPLLLALRGSGQALYIGAAEDAYVVASEPYGLVEQSNRYLRMDGETPSDPMNTDTSRGQVVILNHDHAGDLAAAMSSSGSPTTAPRCRWATATSSTLRSRLATSTAGGSAISC